MGLMIVVIVTIVLGVLILNGVQLDEVKTGILNFLQQFFPKLKEARTVATDDL